MWLEAVCGLRFTYHFNGEGRLMSQRQPSPQPASKCPFCHHAHPPKFICKAGMEAMQEARRQRGRPLRHGRDRVERTR